ncbi:hypothetical protein K525DRAFT_209328 [Schizophyllum commune Loenen D]|nr:hypothetical protein K525DRAFT_209328 [Schizophyllum commune Loenen D]
MPEAETDRSLSPNARSQDNPQPQSLKGRLASFDPHSSDGIMAILPDLRKTEETIDWLYRRIGDVSADLTMRRVFMDEKRELERLRADVIWKRSPLSRLVPDVLRQIFTFVREDAQYSLRNRKSTVLCVAQTCRQWRTVAISHRSLWAYISLGDIADLEGHVARAVRCHFDRSGTTPLVVDISGKSTPAHLAVIAEHHRWRVCIMRGNMLWYTGIQAAPAPSYPLLERLELRVSEVDNHFSNTPRLRVYHGSVDDIALPWQQLASLTVAYGRDPNRVVDVLRMCSSLEYLCLSVAVFKSSILPSTPALPPLHRLRHMVLRSRHGEFAMQLRTLALIHAPALEVLDVCIIHSDARHRRSVLASDLAGVLVDILSQSRALRTLGLRNITLDRGALHHVLASAQSVERLIWVGTKEPAYNSGILDLADVLSPSHTSDAAAAHDSVGGPSNHTILPRLSHLEIDYGSTLVIPKYIARSIHWREVRAGEGKDAATRQEVALGYSTWYTLDAHDRSELGYALRSLKSRKDTERRHGRFRLR